MSAVQVDLATVHDQAALRQLLELYAHDFSERNGADVGDDGTYGYRHLDRYWSEADRHPFLFRVEGRLAGFALVRTGPPHDMIRKIPYLDTFTAGIGQHLRTFGKFPAKTVVGGVG